MKIEPKYDITDTVYHITPESEKGIIIDWKYHRIDNEIYYLVATGFGASHWCTQHELTEEKQVV